MLVNSCTSPSIAKYKIAAAVAIPRTVFIFCPDFHSSFMVSKVIIESINAVMMKLAVIMKKRPMLLSTVKVVRMPEPIITTPILGLMVICEVTFFASETKSILEPQIIECTVPKIAERTDMRIAVINQNFPGNVRLNMSGNCMPVEKYPIGVAKIREPMNNVYSMPTMMMEYVTARGTFFQGLILR